MGLIVQKFGGTSVADPEKIQAAARKAIRAQQQGNRVVVVVSAMGHQTDELIRLAHQVNPRPPAREMDMLLSTGEQVSVALMAMAVQAMGYQAISLTGAQVGIRTDSIFSKARIRSISTQRVQQLLNQGQIVIAAGFQGIDENYNITTLGRGGSDTTAVALAAVLGADQCEIYTDVDGVYTTDPRLLPEARLMDYVSYDEMLELASLGAGVMHSRAIEFGKKFDVPIHVRSSFSDIPGTLITTEPESRTRPVTGAAWVRNEARVTLRGVPDRPGVSLALFAPIAQRNIAVDMIVQNVGADGRADISFTVPHADLEAALEAVEQTARELGAQGVDSNNQVAKISVVGLGMARQTGVARRMFQALAQAGVNILMITTSEIKISVLVPEEQGLAALRAVHQAFRLHEKPEDAPPPHQGKVQRRGSSNAVAVVEHLRGMEDLLVESVELDDTQSRVTLAGVPDRPGVAAQVFDALGQQGVFVDMIVQSFGREGLASLSFTVNQQDLAAALRVAQQVAQPLGARVSHAEQMAKLSVTGVGMRSHAGVAIRMFEALARQKINIDMTSTSEVRINVVVAREDGSRGLAALREAFADAMA